MLDVPNVNNLSQTGQKRVHLRRTRDTGNKGVLYYYLGEWAIASHGRVLVPQGGWWFQYVNILYIGINFTTFCFLGGAFKVCQLRIILLDVLN